MNSDSDSENNKDLIDFEESVVENKIIHEENKSGIIKVKIVEFEEKNLLNKSFRVPNLEATGNSSNLRIGTRSQTGIVHFDLDSVKKINKFKMTSQDVKEKVTIKLEEAISLIPTCSGENDLHQFINACDLAISAIDPEYIPLLNKYIATKLVGRANDCTKFRDSSKWINIKQLLLNTFESKHTSASLQVQLNSVKMRENEDVPTYTNRVEELFYKLSNACTANKTKNDAGVIRETLKEQALVAFIKGLREPLKMLVKSRNPATLEIAMSIARAEEIELNSENESRDYYANRSNRRFNNNNNNNYRNENNVSRYNNSRWENNNYRGNNYRGNENNRSSSNRGYNRNNNFTQNNDNFNSRNNYSEKNCYHCQRPGHIASHCRDKQLQNNNYNNRPPNFNNNSNNFTRQPTNYNSKIVSCNYCNRGGHDVSNCYKKRNDENKNNQNQGNSQISNAATHGTRSINQIVSVDQSEIASTSCQ